jgi:hypothetical protein
MKGRGGVAYMELPLLDMVVCVDVESERDEGSSYPFRYVAWATVR